MLPDLAILGTSISYLALKSNHNLTSIRFRIGALFIFSGVCSSPLFGSVFFAVASWQHCTRKGGRKGPSACRVTGREEYKKHSHFFCFLSSFFRDGGATHCNRSTLLPTHTSTTNERGREGWKLKAQSTFPPPPKTKF